MNRVSLNPGVKMVKVPDDRAGQRLDNFLLGQLKGAPRSLISTTRQSWCEITCTRRMQAPSVS